MKAVFSKNFSARWNGCL